MINSKRPPSGMASRAFTARFMMICPIWPSAAAEPKPASKPEVAKTAHVLAIEDELRKKLAMRVTIKLHGKDKGQVVLGFDSNDDFERLVEVVRKAA